MTYCFYASTTAKYWRFVIKMSQKIYRACRAWMLPLKNLLFPQFCLYCSVPLERNGSFLCTECQKILVPLDPRTSCLYCGAETSKRHSSLCVPLEHPRKHETVLRDDFLRMGCARPVIAYALRVWSDSPDLPFVGQKHKGEAKQEVLFKVMRSLLINPCAQETLAQALWVALMQRPWPYPDLIIVGHGRRRSAAAHSRANRNTRSNCSSFTVENETRSEQKLLKSYNLLLARSLLLHIAQSQHEDRRVLAAQLPSMFREQEHTTTPRLIHLLAYGPCVYTDFVDVYGSSNQTSMIALSQSLVRNVLWVSAIGEHDHFMNWVYSHEWAQQDRHFLLSLI